MCTKKSCIACGKELSESNYKEIQIHSIHAYMCEPCFDELNEKRSIVINIEDEEKLLFKSQN